jgi:hypothetical protein
MNALRIVRDITPVHVVEPAKKAKKSASRRKK